MLGHVRPLLKYLKVVTSVSLFSRWGLRGQGKSPCDLLVLSIRLLSLGALGCDLARGLVLAHALELLAGVETRSGVESSCPFLPA